MYILKYYKNIVQRGNVVMSYEDFIRVNPHIPLVENVFFELRHNKIILINEDGSGNYGDLNDFTDLIAALNAKTDDENKSFSADIKISENLLLDGVELTEKDSNKVAIDFVVKNNKQVWRYRDKTQQEISDDIKKNALAEILRLEAEIKPRRIIEKILGFGNGWLANQYALIEIERAKL